MTSRTLPASTATPLRDGPALGWGVVGPGGIADAFAGTVRANTDQRLVAVASRSRERAATFAARHAIGNVYEDYEGLLADPSVDIVYVAAPHGAHQSLALAAIDAGKHVLVEKPLAVTAGEAVMIKTAAAAAGVLAAEAMWTRYLPQFTVLDQILRRGDLGDVRLATADVGWKMDSTAPARFFDRREGGAALDMGVYGYWFAQFAVGPPCRIRTVGSLTAEGVDDQAAAALDAGNGRHATVTTSMAVTTSGLAAIHGTQGSVRFLDPFVFPARFVATIGNDAYEWADHSGLTSRDGLAWQTTALARYVAEGLTDSPLHSLDDAISVLRTIDTVRNQIRNQHDSESGATAR